MRKLFFLLLASVCIQAQAQNNLTNNIIEGGKVVVDILRVFKTPRKAISPSAIVAQTITDSCSAKAIADVCYKNTSGKSLYINLYKRNGNAYTTVPLTLTIQNNTKECLYEIQAGIYKYKIEYEEEGKKAAYKEGEIKIGACDKKQEDIK
jgi:hypothetical protein